MSNIINPLPIHPFPKNKHTIGNWIELLAKANKIKFKSLMFYIIKLSEKTDFIHTLALLTGYPIGKIYFIRNEFKMELTANLKACPIKGYAFIGKSFSNTYIHVATDHNLGIVWYKCAHCEFKSKDPYTYRSHLSNKHNIKAIWHYCRYCDFKTKNAYTLVYHLAMEHQVGAAWYMCHYCDFKSKNKIQFRKHLVNFHSIQLK